MVGLWWRECLSSSWYSWWQDHPGDAATQLHDNVAKWPQLVKPRNISNGTRWNTCPHQYVLQMALVDLPGPHFRATHFISCSYQTKPPSMKPFSRHKTEYLHHKTCIHICLLHKRSDVNLWQNEMVMIKRSTANLKKHQDKMIIYKIVSDACNIGMRSNKESLYHDWSLLPCLTELQLFANTRFASEVLLKRGGLTRLRLFALSTVGLDWLWPGERGVFISLPAIEGSNMAAGCAYVNLRWTEVVAATAWLLMQREGHSVPLYLLTRCHDDSVVSTSHIYPPNTACVQKSTSLLLRFPRKRQSKIMFSRHRITQRWSYLPLININMWLSFTRCVQVTEASVPANRGQIIANHCGLFDDAS